MTLHKTWLYRIIAILITGILLASFGYIAVKQYYFGDSATSNSIAMLLYPVADGKIAQVEIELIEGKADTVGRPVYLKIATVKEYGDGNYRLRTDVTQHGDQIDIELLDVRHAPGLAFAVVSPASTNLDLGTASRTVQLNILNDGKTDHYLVTISPEQVTIDSDGEPTFSGTDNGVLDRSMNNEFIISCQRYAWLVIDSHCDQFFTAIEALGAVLTSDESDPSSVDKYRRTYGYNSSLEDFNSVLDQYDDEDHALRVFSNMGNLAREAYQCNKVWDETPERLSPAGQDLMTVSVPAYHLNIQVPSSWHVLYREGEPLRIDTATCNKMTLSMDDRSYDEFVPADSKISTQTVTPVELGGRVWQRMVTKNVIRGTVNSVVLFTEHQGVIYSMSAGRGDAALEESYRQVLALIDFTE